MISGKNCSVLQRLGGRTNALIYWILRVLKTMNHIADWMPWHTNSATTGFMIAIHWIKP